MPTRCGSWSGKCTRPVRCIVARHPLSRVWRPRLSWTGASTRRRRRGCWPISTSCFVDVTDQWRTFIIGRHRHPVQVRSLAAMLPGSVVTAQRSPCFLAVWVASRRPSWLEYLPWHRPVMVAVGGIMCRAGALPAIAIQLGRRWLTVTFELAASWAPHRPHSPSARLTVGLMGRSVAATGMGIPLVRWRRRRCVRCQPSSP